MPRISKASFACVTTQGGLFPAEFLARVAAGDGKGAPEGLEPADYHLPGSERLPEAVNRSWNTIKGRWEDFRKRAGQQAPGDHATGLTREHWLLPLFQELGFGRLQAPPRKIEIDDREYPVSHMWGGVPIHLLGIGLEIDRRTPGAAGAARMSPHAMLQEYLNRSETALWGIVTNGRTLRLLRDNAALTRQAYVEFDLQGIFDGNHFSDFALLWLLCHQSRFEGGRPELSWLEKWTQEARKQGVRLLEHLRDGVEKSIEALGTGFLAHPVNQPLRDRLHAGTLATQDYYRQVLRLVYRLIFLFVAEDRDLLLLPSAPAAARDRYRRFYSTRRLRDLALRRAGTAHGDLWEMLALVMRALGSDDGCPALALPALGSFLWSDAATPDLSGMKLANRHLLDALRCLAAMRSQEEKVRRVVDYRNLGAEELGSVYESLLELHPQINLSARTFALSMTAGNERKTSGSYYTPDSLVQFLLDSALDPVMDEAVKGRKGTAAADAILALKVCDPAVGSGHFLIAAAHRMARRVAAARSGEDEPAPDAIHTALRQVIGRCLYGVDINPMSAELCKVSLWMEAMEPGKPLSFLDHHIQCGNSLLGATPGLMARGIPDEAFEPIEGDDRKVCSGLKKRNRQERGGQLDMLHLMAGTAPAPSAALTGEFQDLETLGDASLGEVRQKQDRYSSLVDSPVYRTARLSADAWCAAFVWHKDGTDPAPVTSDVFKRLQADPSQVAKSQRDEIDRLAAQYRFFHWHLAFPEVFQPLDAIGEKDSKGWKGGFDVVLGNPPWDTLSPDQREFFEPYHPGMRSLSSKEQEVALSPLLAEPVIAEAWKRHCRQLYASVHFLKNSMCFTLYASGNLGKGDFNVYRMFVELALQRVRQGGYVAQVVPAGFYGGANASAIRHCMFDENRLDLVVGCENKGESFFPGVHPQTWFALYVAERRGRTEKFRLAFGVDDPSGLGLAVEKATQMDADLIRSQAPETYAIPNIRSASDFTISCKMCAAFPAFGRRDAGGRMRHYQREIEMDSGLLGTDPAGLPVYEGRMIDHFDHRAKTYQSGHGNSSVWIERPFGDPAKAIVPQWRIQRKDIPAKLGDRVDRYRLGFGDVANPRNERSFIATLIPPSTTCGNTVPTIDFGWDDEWWYLPWLAVANSFVMDALVRSKLSSQHLKPYVVDSLPFPRPALEDDFVQSIAGIVLRLVCTAPEMTAYWNAMAKLGLCEPVPDGTVPPDALTTPEPRAHARAHLDAIVARDIFHLTRQELSDILDTFAVLKRRDEKAHGAFRTKDLILRAFDER